MTSNNGVLTVDSMRMHKDALQYVCNEINHLSVDDYDYYLDLMIKNVSRDLILTEKETKDLTQFKAMLSLEQWQHWLTFARAEKKRRIKNKDNLLRQKAEIDTVSCRSHGVASTDNGTIKTLADNGSCTSAAVLSHNEPAPRNSKVVHSVFSDTETGIALSPSNQRCASPSIQRVARSAQKCAANTVTDSNGVSLRIVRHTRSQSTSRSQPQRSTTSSEALRGDRTPRAECRHQTNEQQGTMGDRARSLSSSTISPVVAFGARLHPTVPRAAIDIADLSYAAPSPTIQRPRRGANSTGERLADSPSSTPANHLDAEVLQTSVARLDSAYLAARKLLGAFRDRRLTEPSSSIHPANGFVGASGGDLSAAEEVLGEMIESMVLSRAAIAQLHRREEAVSNPSAVSTSLQTLELLPEETTADTVVCNRLDTRFKHDSPPVSLRHCSRRSHSECNDMLLGASLYSSFQSSLFRRGTGKTNAAFAALKHRSRVSCLCAVQGPLVKVSCACVACLFLS